MISLIKKKGINPQTKTVIYFPQWTRIATVNKTQLAKRMARGGTFSVGECEGMMTDFPQFITDELLNGNAVKIEGLGTFKLKVSGKARAKAEDVTSQGATLAVTFEPDETLTSRLNDEREFQFVTKPTAEGEQDVTDNTDTNTGGGNSGGTGGTTPSTDEGDTGGGEIGGD